jgi:superfamily II DNA or RNA helicase
VINDRRLDGLRLTPNPGLYAGARFPELRDFQALAHEGLRRGFAKGHRCQLVMAPTGAGKTVVGLNIILQSLLRGRTGMFVCDRTTLIEQTSERATAFGMPHGIIQADHERTNHDRPFQIASAQTLESRGWPQADVIVIDEAHTQLGAWTEHLQKSTAAFVGLSATPFSKGLGKLFTNLIQAATMSELTRNGTLVPMRVFSCTTPDMAGAATSGGEWTDKAAEERGMAIVGDVVSEWAKYGEDRKTICFGATVRHCEELLSQFSKAGVMAALYTGHTPPAERRALVEEYSKPGSLLRVLISVEALAKGFDAPDVGCVIDCRPLRKSLSTAVQMWGRGLRSAPGKSDCVARGTLVLTDVGEVPIENLTLAHRVWDGENFVEHSGAVCRGVQKVIEYDGLIATANHEVWTHEGWTQIQDAARKGLRIARTGIDGHPVRLQAQEGLDPKYGAEVVEASLLESAQQMHQSETGGVQELRRAWDRVSLSVGRARGQLDHEEPRDRGPVDGHRSHRQQRALRAGQPALGNAQREHHQLAEEGAGSVHRIPHGTPGGQVRGLHAKEIHRQRPLGRGDCGALGDAVVQAEREVWDVHNAGPLQRFTANGRLVHNCILLDHSGNIIRFGKDFQDLFFDGLASLDAGERLDSTVRKDAEPGDPPKKGCPSCGFKPFHSRCMSCGFEIPIVATEEHLPGEMRELSLKDRRQLEIAEAKAKGQVLIGKDRVRIDLQQLYNECLGHARNNSAPERQKGRAAHLFKSIVGDWPEASWHQTAPTQIAISDAVRRAITASNIRSQKSRAKYMKGTW